MVLYWKSPDLRTEAGPPSLTSTHPMNLLWIQEIASERFIHGFPELSSFTSSSH